MIEFSETPSRETVHGDIEGIAFTCQAPDFDREGRTFGCGYEGHLVAVDWDTPDWARVVCPRCFTAEWVRVYE